MYLSISCKGYLRPLAGLARWRRTNLQLGQGKQQMSRINKSERSERVLQSSNRRDSNTDNTEGEVYCAERDFRRVKWSVEVEEDSKDSIRLVNKTKRY